MNKYETIFLMKKDLTEEQQTKIINTIKNYISTNGKIITEQDMGVRKLAYEIRKKKEAHYYLIDFESESTAIQELERIYRITEEIIKFIVVRKDD